MMDITRNQYFFAGILFALLGMEFYMVDSFQLTPDFTQFLAERTGHPIAAVSAATQMFTQSEKPAVPGKTIRPPESLGWALMSLGAVLVLHSWAMKKPGS